MKERERERERDKETKRKKEDERYIRTAKSEGGLWLQAEQHKQTRFIPVRGDSTQRQVYSP